MSYVTIDLTGLCGAGIAGNGISFDEIQSIEPQASAAHSAALARMESGEVGFPKLAEDTNLARSAMDYARALPDTVDTMVVLGIGGSSLGPNALYQALSHPFDNLRSRAPGMPRRLFFPDNSDPETLAGLLDVVQLERTVFNIVTKSGGTAETAAQTLVVLDALEKALGRDRMAQHVVATTDPERGALRGISERFGFATFPIPPAVGGRFSVLSAVGLLPAAVAGFDVMGLLKGARDMRDRVLGADTGGLWQNPALMLAVLLYAHDRDRSRRTVVMMPYADGLYGCADWFRQLWGESLGKTIDDGGKKTHVGPMPVASRGATDQHSQLQLYVEGPDDKVFLTVAPRRRRTQLPLPAAGIADVDAYGYLVGKTMAELIDAELRGTAASLRARGRPVGMIWLESMSAEAVGAYVMLLQAATAFSGELYGVNAYDQPGVEEAKRLAFGSLGRDGFDPPAEQHVSSDERYVL